MRKSKKLSAFEFLFGFSKTLVKKYDFLNLDSKGKKDDEVTAIGFELFDVCVNNSKHISDLAEIIADKKIDLNLFDRRINETIVFVRDALAPICTFRGNSRNIQYLHPKYLILALISFVFREMYNLEDMSHKKDTWNSNMQSVVAKRLLSHYVFEIVSNDWHEGGIGKMYSAVKERSFMEEYERKNWESLLNSYFDAELLVRQTSRFSSPTNADKLLLNCIYTDIFTVKDNCPTQNYDIEHLATKDYMKNLMIQVGNDKGLPVSHIANLCYLPESINRGKKERTIYEDGSMTIPLSEIERKYSLTTKNDFDFLYDTYEKTDAKVLENAYVSFLTRRYSLQKKKILAFLGYKD